MFHMCSCVVVHLILYKSHHCLNVLSEFVLGKYSHNKDMLGGTVTFIPIPVWETSAATAWINESSRGLFSSTTQGSLCGPQKKIGGLIKGALGSAEWRIVMEKLDSVNVFIFSVLKFKKWNPSLAPGCALSCLKRSDYLLRLWKGGLEGLAHQLITKQQKDAVHLFFLVGKREKNDRRTWLIIGFCTLWDHFFAQRRVTVSGLWLLLLPAMLPKTASNISTLGETWSLNFGTLKAMCTVHSAPGDQTLHACSVSILLFRLWVMNWIINETSHCMNIISGWKFIQFWHSGGNFTFYAETSSFLLL